MQLDPALAISDAGYIFNPATGDSFSINPTALLVVQQLKEGMQLPAIVTSVTRQFDVPAAIAERDVEDFISYLRQLKMITHE